MDVRASKNSLRPTHNLSLSDGVTEIGLILCDAKGNPSTGGRPWTMRETGMQRTGLKITSGDPSYSDEQLPYSTFTQKDWSGGRAQEEFEEDKSRFYDSFRVDTRMGDIVLGPKDTVNRISVPLISDSPEIFEPVTTAVVISSPVSSLPLFNNGIYASSFAVPAGKTFFMRSLTFYASPGVAHVTIKSDTADNPGTYVTARTITIQQTGSSATELHQATVYLSVNLTAGTYWVVIESSGTIGANVLAGNIVKKWSVPNWVQVSDGHSLYFYITSLWSNKLHFFEYKGSLYAVTKPDNGSVSRLYLNGYRFVPSTGSTTTVINAPTAALAGCATNALAGKILKVAGGQCYNEDTNFQTIVSNTSGANPTITVSPGFEQAPNATSVVVILGCDTWAEITGTGLTDAVTSLIVCSNIVYFAQGEDVAIRKMQETIVSSVWTRAWAFDGYVNAGATTPTATTGNKASFLMVAPTNTGKNRIWKFNNPESTKSMATYADPPVWSTTHGNNFVTKPKAVGSNDWPIPIGQMESKITGVALYGEPLIPWVMKEDEFGSIANGVYAPTPIGEMRNVRSEINGRIALQFGVYLFFSMRESIERYYDNRLDDMGPNRDEGFPIGRKGNISAITTYPGGLIIGVDAGLNQTSCVLYWNQLGYHEIYRAPAGKRVRNLYVQVTPGDTVDRLYVSLGSEMVWLPITPNPRQQADYQFADKGNITSSWMNGGFGQINKFWKSIQLFTENLSTTHRYIQAEYQTDVDSVWHSLPSTHALSPMSEVLMTSDYTAYGKRWRYRLTLVTDDPLQSPRLKAITIPAITRLASRQSWNITFLADDAAVDMQGVKETLGADGLIAKLKQWADSDLYATPLTLRSLVGTFDNYHVFIDPPTIQPIEVIAENGQPSVKNVVSVNVYGV